MIKPFIYIYGYIIIRLNCVIFIFIMINQSRYRSFIWIYMASISLSLGTLVYSNIVNSMNDAMNTMLIVFDISDQYKSVIRGMLTGSAYLGALIGVIMSSFIIHLSTRKLTFIMDAFMIIGLSLLTINNLPLFLIGRILAGVGGGMSSILTAIFVKQLAPKEIYGYIGGISQILYTITFLFIFVKIWHGLLFNCFLWTTLLRYRWIS